MLLLNRILPFLSSIAILALLEMFFYFSWNPIATAGGMVVVVWLTLWQLHGRKFLDRGMWSLFVSPAFFLLGGFLFLLFFEHPTFIHSLIVILSFLIFLYVNDIFLFLFRPFRYHAYSLENISNVLNLVSVWTWSASLLGMIILLQLPVLLAAMIFFVVTTFIQYETLWIHKFSIRETWRHIFLTAFVLTEFFVALSFLPTGFYANGTALAGIFYAFSGVERRHLLKTLDTKTLLRFLMVGVGVALVALLTARWE